jgi:uncharacterized membrane protein
VYKNKKFTFQLILLLLWIVIGAILRFTNLTAKPLWIDEFATLVFSLGNSFQTVPLNQIISVDTLLQPIQPHLDKVIGDVIHSLLTEDTHPPPYILY